jgi:hypothetical protein
MTLTIDQAIAAAVAGEGDERTVTVPGEFQGLPGAAHGGSLLGVFDALSGVDGSRSLGGIYRRRVPLGVPLSLSVRRQYGEAAFALRDQRGVLVDGTVSAVPGIDETSPSPRLPVSRGRPLPISRDCLACGIDNLLGLHVVLGFDDAAVRGEYEPREVYRRSDGTVSPLALTTLLDEAAFWLGALASGESGMTTDLALTLHRPAGAHTRLVVSGARADTTPLPSDPRYWRTVVTVSDDAGRLIASAVITFVAVRGAAKKLALAMLDVNPRDVVHGAFPAYV